jgi:hypothetical protein
METDLSRAASQGSINCLTHPYTMPAVWKILANIPVNCHVPYLPWCSAALQASQLRPDTITMYSNEIQRQAHVGGTEKADVFFVRIFWARELTLVESPGVDAPA